ncbi:MAG TPA: Flp pilus assembly protein CpaB [Clostridiales bacterium UBA8960]|nr:Flp pilus assembly protein CpaB [Clostridiales bacterium UBA8960]
MKKSSKGIFLLAFLMALIGAGALFVYLRSMDKPVVNEVKTIGVVVAAVDITPRTQLTSEMLKIVQVPEQGVLGTPIGSVESVIGKYSSGSIYADEMVRANALVDSLADELSLKLTGNNRAVTVNVNNLTGVNGLIKPGDFVDVIVVLPPMSENNRTRPNITKLFIQNSEVLAVNKQLFRESTPQTQAQGETEVTSFFITLAVPIMDVEMLVLAKEIGYLELALRPMDSDFIYVTEGAIWQELLLNDMYQMKDVEPEYDIIGRTPLLVDPNAYVYDKYIYYVVQYGDTLRSISQKFYGIESNYTLIQQVNRIDNENMILTGTGIKIPVLAERGDSNGN